MLSTPIVIDIELSIDVTVTETTHCQQTGASVPMQQCNAPVAPQP